MEGIFFLVDETNQKRFVQIDLKIHEELWENFYDILIAESRMNEENIPYDVVKDQLSKYGNS